MYYKDLTNSLIKFSFYTHSFKMNDQVKKIIKASFCPRQKWVHDKDVNNCFKCDKKFHSLYRRKHHCRYCGQIFCSTCSEFFFEGKDLGENQKQIRMCEACYQKCWKYIAKHDQRYLQFRKSGDMSKELPQNIEQIRQKSKSSSFTEQDKIAELQAIIEQYESKSMEDIKSLQDQVMKKYSVLLQVVMKQNQIPLKYFPTILQTVKLIVNRTPPNGMITGNMNICQNVRIKTFYNEDFQLEAMNVVLVKKFFSNKRIKDEYENKRCILVYGNIEAADLVGGGQKEASFQTMINGRIKEMNKLISYCQRTKIDLILLQGTIDKEFQDMLAQNNIVVIPKVKVEHMTRVKIALKVDRIVESVRDVYSYTEQQIIGQVKKIVSCNFRSIKEGNQTKKFFLITPIKQQLGYTLVIKGDDTKILQTLKKEFKFLLQLLVHMKLKIYKVQLDQCIFDSMSESIKNSCYLNNPEMFFSFYAEHHSDILNYLKEKYISYKHISYVESTFEGYPEVTRPGLEEYLKNRQHSFRNKWESFTQICQTIFDQHRIFYSDDDTPLGSYILKKLIGIDKKCSYCCRPNYMHIDVFYSTDQFIKVWVESRIIDMEEKYLTAGQSFSQNPNEEIQMEMIFSDLSKTQIKEKLKCYIECFDCQEQISGKITLFKQHLEFSMLAFLHHIFKGTVSTIIRQSNQKPSNYGKSKKSCQHVKKVRVFEMGDKSLKIFVGKYIINRQCILTPTGRQNFLKVKQQKFLIQKCLLQSMKTEKVVNYLFEEIKSIAELSKNPKFQSMIKNPKTSFIRARNSIVGNGNVRLSQAQCIDMILPELIEQVNKLNNIAQLMISPKRIAHFLDSMKIFHLFVNLLKKSYVIISEVKKSVKKRDLDMKYQAKDFDNDFLLEEIDINSIADSSSVDLNSEYDHTLNGSEISATDMYSNYNDDMQANEMINYEWLQPYQADEPTLNRNQRKTQSNLMSKKTVKASEDEVFKLFKHFSSFMRVEYAYLSYIPCHPHHPQSLIAAALNSQLHKECLTSNSFTKQLSIRIDKLMEGEIIIENDELRKLLTVIEVHERMFAIGEKIVKETKNGSIEITSLYPNQFQILRRKKNVPLQLFIQSVAGSDAWMASGGKSGASFMRSFNDLIVIKKIPQRQFASFKKCLPEYFTHLHEGSLLTPVYGAFTVNKNNGTPEYFIVMQNLFFGMKEWYLYDFKGSVTKRFSRPPTIPLDINYLIDRNSEPIFCKDNVLKHLSSTLDYLAKNNIVDYSLILVVEIQNKNDYYLDGNRFQLGIVDYMRDFGNLEKVENLWKGETGTVQEPIYYKERMLKNLKKYFTQIPL